MHGIQLQANATHEWEKQWLDAALLVGSLENALIVQNETATHMGCSEASNASAFADVSLGRSFGCGPRWRSTWSFSFGGLTRGLCGLSRLRDYESMTSGTFVFKPDEEFDLKRAYDTNATSNECGELLTRFMKLSILHLLSVAANSEQLPGPSQLGEGRRSRRVNIIQISFPGLRVHLEYFIRSINPVSPEIPAQSSPEEEARPPRVSDRAPSFPLHGNRESTNPHTEATTREITEPGNTIYF